MKLAAISHTQEGFAIDASMQDDALVMRLLGDSSIGTEHIATALTRFHDETVERKLPHVTVDMRELQFMNSSGLKFFVSWISRILSLPEEAQYRVRMVYSPQIYWQRRSLAALRAFAGDVLLVVSEP